MSAPTSILGGYVPSPQRWSGNVRISGIADTAVEFIIDDQLPNLGQDPLYPNRDFVLMPRGRMLAPRPTTLTRLDGTTILTLANGVDPNDAPSFVAEGNIPAGYAKYHMYRNFSGLPADKPLVTLHDTIELPYTLTNESYNNTNNGGTRLKVGEWMMPYYGSATKQTPIPVDRGKLVRWVGKQVLSVTVAATGNVALTNAVYPAFKPRVVLAYAGNTLVTSGATSVNYNETLQKWVAVFSETDVTTVLYEFGAGASQRCAQIIGIEPVGNAGGINASTHELNGWLKWVTNNFGMWDLPPILSRRPDTQIADEVVSISAANTGTLAHAPLVPWETITVKVTGTLTNPDGTTTSLTGAMALADTYFFKDQTQGQYYDINMLTGAITFSSNVSVTTCTVTYSYENNYQDGKKWDAGILNLTDGLNSGIMGLPAHLDVAGIRGVMRVEIR